MDEIEFAGLAQDLHEELRRTSEGRRLLLKFAEARIHVHKSKLSAPLLNERDSDMLRGRIAELQYLAGVIHNGET